MASLDLHFGLGTPAAVLAAISFVLSIAVGLYSGVHTQRRRKRATGHGGRPEKTTRADRTAVASPPARAPERNSFEERVGVQERERRRWARELHDETLQGLGGLRMLLGAARRQSDHDQLVRAVDTALEMVTDEIQKLRHLIVDLRPAELDEIGLAAAIDKLAARITTLGGPEVTTDVKLDYELGRSATRLAPDIETAVYRIVQEALTNAVKHAAARSVHVRIADSDGRVEARVSDDGSGFTGATDDDNLGILGMRERATLIAGRLTILTSATGTTVQVVAPVVRSN